MLFTFPSRYWSTIGQTGILRLTQRSGRIHTGFHEARATRDTATTRPCAFGYGAITLYGPVSNPVRLTHGFITGGRRVGTGTAAPTTPMPQPPTGITRHRFSHHPLSLATTHGVSFPAGTEMFHFPAYPPHKTLRCRPTTAGGLPHSDTLGSKPCRRLPEAYRGPTRPSSVLPAKASTIRPWQQTHQPRKKGATGPCHLHWNTLRQLIRSSKHHPHQQCGRLTKTLANTIHAPTRKRARNGSTKSTVRTHPAHPQGRTVHARVHSPVLKPPHHTTPGTHPTKDGTRTAGTEHHPRQGAWRSGNPTACTTPLSTPTTQAGTALTLFQPARDATRPGSQAVKHPIIGAPRAPTKLRRKEVIQPHLPVRLPCYDLVPITSLTLDGSPHKG